MNKIIFVSEPDTMQGTTYGLKNYTQSHIKEILNTCENTSAFYLLEKNSSSQWLNSVVKNSKIIFDCSQSSIDYIIKHVR